MLAWFQYAGWDLQVVEDGTSYMNWYCAWTAPAAEVLTESNQATVGGSCGAELFATLTSMGPAFMKGSTAINADTCAISDA